MTVARKVLFKRISHSAMFWLVRIDPIPILNNENCTVFPYVQTIQIDGSTDDGSEYSPWRGPNWMDNFLRLIPKFIALRSLELYCLNEWDLQGIQRSMPQSIKKNIKEVSMDLQELDMPEFATFVSIFTALETLQFVGGRSPCTLLQSTQGLVSPPSSIRELLFLSSYMLDHVDELNVLKWFVDLHSSKIDSMDPQQLSFQNSVEFRSFLNRFGSTLSKIKFSISGEEDAGTHSIQ
jgi:hypothetical protein